MYDIDGKLFQEAEGIAAVFQYEYDIGDNMTLKRRLNETGQPFGTEENPVSVTEYIVDNAGFSEKTRYYDKDNNLLADGSFFIYISDVKESSNSYELGLKQGQIILRYGNWEYFKEYEYSSQNMLYSETCRTRYSEKELVVCEQMEGDIFVFCRFYLPENISGFSYKGAMKSSQVLDRMEEAYYQWLESGA